MMLGALPTMQEANQRIQNLKSSPYNLQAFATKTGQSYISPTNTSQETYQDFVNTSPVSVQPPSSPAGWPPPQPPTTDYMAMIKKYAPYAIGAIVLYYLILKNKK